MSALPATIYHLTDTVQTYVAPKREEKKTGFAMTPNSVSRDPSISPQAKAVYTLLASYRGGAEHCWPSLKQLAADMGTSVDSVRRWVRELQKRGLVEVEERPGDSSLYRTLTPGTRATPTPCTDTTPGTRATPTPCTDATPPLAPVLPKEEQGRRTSEEEQVGENTREAEPTLPAGVELVDNCPRLTPIAYDGEGKPVHSSEAIAYVTSKAYDIPEGYERPLRAWIETHANIIPRQHDVRALMRLVDTAGEVAVTRAIRKMGNEGYLKFSRLETAVREGGTHG